MKHIKLVPILLLTILSLSGCKDIQCNDDQGFANGPSEYCDKPVIYIYPEEKTDINIKLNFAGDITFSYPEYKDGWEVTAYPDGTLVDKQGREYNYLFWEGKLAKPFSIETGYCIEGKDTVEFFEEKLNKLGLTDKEAADFITYWAPRMENNKYNIISFLTDDELSNIELGVSPEPETSIRVYMVWQPSDIYRDIPEQQLGTTPIRTGYTVVEWGGCELRQINRGRAIEYDIVKLSR